MDLVSEFYVPVLSETMTFDRAVGFFRSDFIYEISKGMSSIIRNGGKVRIITSPDLTEEDIDKIDKGYELKKLIEEKVHDMIKPPENFIEEERANYIAHLIAANLLDIKIAVTNNIKNNGIFHEKWGVLTDQNGHKISMIGSNNDTYSGLKLNHESFELNFSWLAETDKRKIAAKERRFQQMWENEEEGLVISNLPKNILDEILKYKKDQITPEIELIKAARKVIEKMIKEEAVKRPMYPKPEKPNIPHVPEEMIVRDYQWDAFDKWKENNYHGILSMATGTGKTITALNSVVQLYNEKKRLFVIIVCPYQHLVEQWVEDIERFNITPIIGYSKSKQRDWRALLKNQVKLFNISSGERFCCFITTNATYSKEDTRSLLAELKGDILFIVDEAHNIGSETGLIGLLDNYKYRLALSATFERKYDEEGTRQIREYFGGVVFEIGIREAIYEEKCLVEYEYYPVLTFLTDSEFDEYKELSKRIAVGTKRNSHGEIIYISNDAKLAANMRSLLIASSQDKITKLVTFIPELKKTKNNLIYCGAATISLVEMPEFIETDESEYRQVDYVRDLLMGNGIITARFTAEEDVSTRKLIKEQFSNGTIATVVAIRCLDEGVNIPSIERAYILASSKNRKQYIQRRGRVLRTFDNNGYKKERAYIFDFISLPFKIDYTHKFQEGDINLGKTLVKDELERIIEFFDTCSNQSEVIKVIEDLRESYDLKGDDEA
jgi:superfamily II DNA or RNA helicase